MDIYFCKDKGGNLIHLHTQKPKFSGKCFFSIGHLGSFNEDHAKAILGISLKEGECVEGHLEIETK